MGRQAHRGTDEISVVICARNAEATLEKCLQSVRDNNPLEIIVVDGNSTDRTVEIARRYTEKTYCDGGRGLGHARQLGAEMASGTYVAYFDADAVLPQDCLGAMLKELKKKNEHGKYAAINAQIKNLTLRTYWQRAREKGLERFNKVREWSSISTLASISPRDVVVEYGFDAQTVFAEEELDWSYRVLRDGYKIAISSSAFVYHEFPDTLKKFASYQYRYGLGTGRFVWKWKHRLVGPTVLLRTILASPWNVLAALLRGEFKMLLYYLLGGVFSNAGTCVGLFQLMSRSLLKRSKGEPRSHAQAR